jgi:hypothetical protein
MSPLTAEVGTLPVLEHDNLVVTALFNDGYFDSGTLYGGLANDGLVTVADQKYIVNLEAGVDFVGQAFNVD